jgi:hypothetical protein
MDESTVSAILERLELLEKRVAELEQGRILLTDEERTIPRAVIWGRHESN